MIQNTPSRLQKYAAPAALLVACAALALTERYSYLLFHSLAELFGITILFGTFMLTWNARHYLDNGYAYFLGLGALFIALLALLHTLAFKGMGVFAGNDADLPTQLWLATRYTAAVSFLLAPLFVTRRVPTLPVLTTYTILTTLVLASIFVFRVFPTAYVEGVGQTPFKIASEYVISGLFLVALLSLHQHRAAFASRVYRLLAASLVAAAATEIVLTFYVSVSDLSNAVGHLVNIVSFFLLYRALIETGFRQPYDLLWRELRQARDELDLRVQERTAALQRQTQRLEILHDIDRAVLAARSPAEIAGRAASRIRQAIGCARVSVVLFEPEQGLARLLAVDTAGSTAVGTGTLVPLTEVDSGALSPEVRVFATAETLPASGAESMRDALLKEGAHYCLTTPLSVGGRPIGALRAWEQSATAFRPEHCEFLRQVADSLSVALANIRLFDQVQESRAQLQMLTRRLLEVQENERRTIARELHDETGQSLTALKVNLALLEKQAHDPGVVLARIEELKNTADEVLEGLHRVIMSLRPASLDRLGLPAAAGQYIQTFYRRSGIEVEFDTVNLDGQRLPPEIETTLFRVVQEALTNVARHARATRAEVLLIRRPGTVSAVIEDNGIGFDPVEARGRGRLGLLGMGERAEVLGGKITVDSTPGEGTTVVVEIPCPSCGEVNG